MLILVCDSVELDPLSSLKAVLNQLFSAHSLPDVPALAEVLPGFETLAWFGILAPAGTPKAIVERMNSTIQQVLEQADIKARLATLSCDPAPLTPEAFATRVSGDVARWKKLAAEKNIRAE